MNIQQLEYILAVDQFKSFSKAADYCHVTQATLSVMVKKLEEQLNIIIFDRKSNPITATESGKQILVHAQEVVAKANALLASSKSINQSMEGRIKIGVIPTIASSLISIMLKPLVENYPRLNFEIFEVTTNEMVKNLKEGKLDIGILSTPIASNDIETTLLYVEDLCLYGYLASVQSRISKSDLKNQKIFLLQEGHCLRDQVIQLCELKKSKSLPQNLLIESNTFDTLLNLVDEFQGMTVLPKLYVEQMNDQRKTRIMELVDGRLEREVSLAYYRPYAKWNIIQQLSKEIISIVKTHLTPNKSH